VPEVKIVALALLGFFAAGCNGGKQGPSTVTGAGPATSACACPCPSQPATGPTSTAGVGAPTIPLATAPLGSAAATNDLGELVASASRKMMHDDGAGCLADLNKVALLDPQLDKRLAVSRGQCEMLVGKCQEGKKRIADWYRDETNLTQERADVIAESMASMRCRGGDSSARDELLRAFYELTDGAYMNKRDSSFCRERLATVKRLVPKVKPNGPDDSQVASAPKALFYTAAMCFARAEDCKASWQAYRDNYPIEGLSAIKDVKQKDDLIRDSFRSTVERCKGAI
jgi:hypothetical protein